MTPSTSSVSRSMLISVQRRDSAQGTTVVIVGSVLCSIALLIVVTLIIIFYCHKRKRRNSRNDAGSPQPSVTNCLVEENVVAQNRRGSGDSPRGWIMPLPHMRRMKRLTVLGSFINNTHRKSTVESVSSFRASEYNYDPEKGRSSSPDLVHHPAVRQFIPSRDPHSLVHSSVARLQHPPAATIPEDNSIYSFGGVPITPLVEMFGLSTPHSAADVELASLPPLSWQRRSQVSQRRDSEYWDGVGPATSYYAVPIGMEGHVSQDDDDCPTPNRPLQDPPPTPVTCVVDSDRPSSPTGYEGSREGGSWSGVGREFRYDSPTLPRGWSPWKLSG
jgi:hypothetical protein